MTKVLIFSDSHGDNSLMEFVTNKEKPDFKIHLGDYCVSETYMKKNFNFYVKGNNDFFGKEKEIIIIDNIKFLLIHGDIFGHYELPPTNSDSKKILNFLKENDCNVLLFGHTHIPYFYKNKDYKILNPGSISFPRSSPYKKSYAILYIEKGKILNDNFYEIIQYVD